MPRTFGSNFNTEKNKKHTPAPFLTAIIRFGATHGGDLALIGRAIRGIGFKQPVVNSITHYTIVKDWGRLGSGFGALSDGTPDQPEVNLVCTNFLIPTLGYRLSDRFIAEMETIPIDFFWNFLVGTTVYQEDGPSGSVHSPTTFGFRDVSLRVTSLMDTYLMRDVLRVVTGTDFPQAPQESLGKGIPIAIGDTTAVGFDGARIPAVVVDPEDGNGRTVLIACENPAEMPVTSIGSIYYNGHKIILQDFSIAETVGTSETVPLQVRAAEQTIDPMGGTIPDTFDVGVLSDMNTPTKLGDSTLRISHIVQPFIAHDKIAIVDAAISATSHDESSPPYTTSNAPLRSLTMGFMSQADMDQNDGGLVTPSMLTGDITRWRARGLAYDVVPEEQTTFPEGAGNDSSAFFNMHSWSPAVGAQHYAVAYVGGSSAGIPADPAVQWYNIGLTAFPASHTPNTNGVELNQPAYAVDFDGNVTSLGSMYLPVQLFSRTNSKGTNVETEEGGAIDDASASGIFSTMLEPDAAVVLCGITLNLRKRLPLGAPSGTQTTLTGSLMVTVREVDVHGAVVQELGSAEYTAEDFDGTLSQTSYTPLFKLFGNPMLLLETKRYELRIEGQFDSTGQFSSWVVQAVTAGAFDAWLASLPKPRPNTSYSLFNAFGPSRQLVTTTINEPAAVKMTLHCLKFDKTLENDITGRPVAVLRPYVLTSPKAFVIPDGVTIGSDVFVAKTRPDVVVHALLNRATVPDARIDLAGTFTDSAALYSTTYKVRGAVVDQITYKALLARIAFEMRSDFDWEFHQAQLKWLPAPGDVVTSAKTITLPDIPRLSETDPLPDFHITRTEATDVVNTIDLFFQRMFDVAASTTNEHGKIAAFILGESFWSIPSQDVHGEKRKDELFRMDFIRDPAVAEAVGLFYVLWLAFARHKPIFTTELQNLELMKGDVITLDLTPIVGTEIFNGWAAEPILVRAIQHDWATQTIQFTGVVQA